MAASDNDISLNDLIEELYTLVKAVHLLAQSEADASSVGELPETRMELDSLLLRRVYMNIRTSSAELSRAFPGIDKELEHVRVTKDEVDEMLIADAARIAEATVGNDWIPLDELFGNDENPVS